MLRTFLHASRPALLAVALLTIGTGAAQAAMQDTMTSTDKTATAVLGGGCFWCLQHDLENLPGVVKTTAGYAGGDRPNPTYETYHDLNATYKVPHIEVVEIVYDPATLTYAELLHTFLRKVDPTDGGGQFCDRGPSYRPAIFVANGDEKATAQAALKEARAVLHKPIQVDILPTAPFWAAEGYHQHYADKNPARYSFYRWNCGRDQRVKTVWGDK